MPFTFQLKHRISATIASTSLRLGHVYRGGDGSGFGTHVSYATIAVSSGTRVAWACKYAMICRRMATCSQEKLAVNRTWYQGGNPNPDVPS